MFRFFRSAKKGHHPDYLLLASVFVLALGGLVILSSASSNIGEIKFNDSYYYLKHQIYFGLTLGIIGFLVAYFTHYQSYQKIALPLLLLNVGLLALVFTKLGVTAGGASRWLALGPVTFQPAELLKISFVIYLSAWLSSARANRSQRAVEGLLPFLVISGIIGGLLVLQPATSTVVILLTTGLGIYFLSGAKLRYVAAIVGLGALALTTLIVVTPYRMTRVMSFFDRDSDTLGTNYHLNQALIAIGSGGVTGVGYGQSTAKISSLPAVIDDSIFAVLGQELGFVGASTLVVFFALLVSRLFWMAHRFRDRFGKLILVGFGSIIALQSIVNIGAISGLLPLTGVPLPFISYGGTALAVFLTMSGIAANISKYT